MSITTKWIPQPRQWEVLQNNAYETLIGGSRGGGKTTTVIVWMIDPEYLTHPHYRGLVIRKNFTDLTDFIDRATEHYRSYGGKLRFGSEFHFPSGAIIRLGHLADHNSFSKYLGHEYQKIAIEELTLTAEEKLYVKILGSCRSSYRELPPRIMSSTNPGNVGHAWVKRRFIDQGEPNVPFFPDDLKGRSRIFMPMSLDDNEALMLNDPDYVLFLEGLKETDPALYRAWRLGDWNAFEGQYFPEFFTHIHVKPQRIIRPEEIIFRAVGVDYGYRSPSCALWGALLTDKTVVIYRELYQTKLTYVDLARKIMEMTPEDERENCSVVVDPSILEKRGDHSHTSGREQMVSGGLELPIYAAKNSRISGWHVVREHLRSEYNPNTDREEARLQIFQNCRNLITTLPTLVYDDHNPEDLNTKQEDHAADALRYLLVELNGGFTDVDSFTKINSEFARRGQNPLKQVF